jgi:hypothetical protein
MVSYLSFDRYLNVLVVMPSVSHILVASYQNTRHFTVLVMTGSQKISPVEVVKMHKQCNAKARKESPQVCPVIYVAGKYFTDN